MPSNAPVPGVNDLASQYPLVAAEADGWDPQTVTAGSGIKRAWKCRHGHTWSASPGSRTGSGTGCPYCANLRVWVGFNDLKTHHPDIANQADNWDPETVVSGSNKKKDWICQLGHRWQAQVSHRTARGSGCPYCAGQKVLAGFNDLKTRYPEVAKEANGWDPSQIMPGNNKVFSWKCQRGHSWKASVNSRTNLGNGCPYCSNHKCWTGFNDMATTFPDIAKEADGWDPTKILGGCNTKLPWKCNLGHKWEVPPSKRTSRGDGCPYCGNKRVLAGFNDLKTRYPEIAKDADGWDPAQVMPGDTKKRSWKCSLGHTYLTAANWRTSQNSGCPYCSNNLAWSGYNDIKTHHPEIAKSAHGWDPSKVLPRSGKKVNWICSIGHIFSMAPDQRIGNGNGCPYCAGQKVLAGFNDLKTRYPEIAKEADGWDPSKIMPFSNKIKSWKCEKGHKWKTTVGVRSSGSGCPICAETGFKRDKEAWFYLMERPGEQQLGITNDLQMRMKHHERYGWQQIDLAGPSEGELVYQAEKALKHWLRTTIGCIAGTTENWTTTAMEVRSLAELKARSGVETDLF